MSESLERMTLGPIRNPVRALLHGAAALCAAVFALLLLDGQAVDPSARIPLLVFAASQACLFGVSASYHALPFFSPAKAWMQRLDHAMIYVGIAGLLTPVAWLALPDPWRLALLAASWAIAGAGALQKLWCTDLPERASIPVQLFQAALALPPLVALVLAHPGTPALQAGVSACCFATGAAAFLTRRPVLWPRVFSFHEVFHVLVVAGSALIGALAQGFASTGG